ncbi:unnamed protein product [Zymoseptoria tritici ST99CH_1A5]|uniref:Uncharacterized protein n=1 Tax=Zymoseptoria tritici ST99CH_1A5 TaxID=1276529 RepID=A0A1Y6L578_ZYMTR|nr:unnamed protein product [Zymoseptoria tritici ST99CH_1A5]
MDWGETKVVYPQLHAKLAPPSLVSRQRSFLRLITDRPTLAKHVKSFTWTLVWGHVGAKRTDREDEAEPTLLPIDRQTWNIFFAIINVTTLDLASIHDVWEDKLIRQSPPCLFPSVRDLRLCGWMHRGLVRAILDSIDTSKLHSLKLDSLDDEGALPGGGPIEQGTAFYFSKNINQGLISVYEELVIDDDLFERQEQSVAAIFPGPMWFPLRVLSSATSGSLSTIRLKVSPFDGEIDIRNYYTLFRQAASLIRNASSTLKSLTIIFGESLYLYNLRSERYGTHTRKALSISSSSRDVAGFNATGLPREYQRESMNTWKRGIARQSRSIWLFLVCCTIGATVFYCSTTVLYGSAAGISFVRLFKPHAHLEDEVALVVASQKGDDTAWLDAFSKWTRSIYVTDDPTAALTVPMNKGREGMVYLTYIIDNYDHLPSTVIFTHSERYQWHNDDPLYDGQSVLARLNTTYVREEGYVNLRCGWHLGCPAAIRPLEQAKLPAPASDPTSEHAEAGSFYKSAFEDMFPDTPVPDAIGVGCCAQFAVSADTIRSRSVEDYQRYRGWLVRTELNDDLSGRMMEYLWHIIFGKGPVHCPRAEDCYCKVYGMCDLPCEDDGGCKAVYTLPPFSSLPEGWPDVDWTGDSRNSDELRLKFDTEYGPNL